MDSPLSVLTYCRGLKIAMAFRPWAKCSRVEYRALALPQTVVTCTLMVANKVIAEVILKVLLIRLSFNKDQR